MKSISFPISHKENEFRRAILPEHIRFMRHPEMLYFETDYGNVMGVSNEAYADTGAHVVSREEVLSQNIICDPKIGDADYLSELREGQIIFGWVHATQNRDITDKLLKTKVSAFAWEKMFYQGRHIFWRNNELAGEAAVLHAFQCFGMMPYEATVAVIGRGNTARGAIRALNMLGAHVVQYDRRMENLLREEIGKYDVIVNCVLWDVMRKDHIIYKENLKSMKKQSMIIDISCDKSGGIETSIPTTIENPVYEVEGVLHYVVDHTPSIYYKTFTHDNSEIIYPFLDQLIEDKLSDVLNNALIISDGTIVDSEIIKYQGRDTKVYVPR